ncbi:hypothetical protein DERF_014207 [Dermatophagoides farinae]|uniref:Uncharacterized protein n=1 Tax=Dermatophagoides farinae TaxID=6954 RepID=A0A922HMH1_DERFA|nr:hypothetical protein DERF_014207 [Dermatophagoides farinae]
MKITKTEPLIQTICIVITKHLFIYSNETMMMMTMMIEIMNHYLLVGLVGWFIDIMAIGYFDR